MRGRRLRAADGRRHPEVRGLKPARPSGQGQETPWIRELILPSMSALRAWVGRLPRPVIESLRSTRTAALWLLEPLDRLRRRVTLAPDRRPVPPLWLRRHAGPISTFERAATELSATIATLGLVRADDTVLDIGCGCGSMALAFRRTLGPRGTYVGFDVHGASIAWCNRHLAQDPRLRFELAPLDTPWSRGGMPPTQYRFPADDGSADFVLAKSVFTHLLERDARHYLREIHRVLRPSSWIPPKSPSPTAAPIYGGVSGPGPRPRWHTGAPTLSRWSGRLPCASRRRLTASRTSSS